MRDDSVSHKNLLQRIYLMHMEKKENKKTVYKFEKMEKKLLNKK